MASSFTTNALRINFDSVLGIIDNAGMVNMFKALESTWLSGFLGCPSVLYERELEQFFDTTMGKDGDITCEVSGKVVAISDDRFAGVFGLPIEGLVNLSEVPKDLVYDPRSIFSLSSEPISTYGKKRLMKYEFRLFNDILAKSITVKAGSFDAVMHERFLMMTAIHFGIKGDSSATMGDATTFPPLKILSEKTVKTYIATNETINARGKTDEPSVAKIVLEEHCDVLSMQMDSDLVIYRTTLVRTFHVVTICRVDKSEALSVIPRGSWDDVVRRFTKIRWGCIAHNTTHSKTLVAASLSSLLLTAAAPLCAAAPPPPVASVGLVPTVSMKRFRS
ncbi:hypothetical protein F511_33321 [Dorcoceras hygrometricum]|uniref:Dystroglycan-like n=1 Tax=Dorcoceras hygrometricum TaxID=472368 RepID=A0A2Z7AC41_9LAMI|nr:hypothetical protein F511_33321 [Dorcoceras hygrometricum]